MDNSLDEKESLRAKLHMINPAVWVLDNEFVNEDQHPIEFTDHRFMLQPYSDSSPEQVIRKSAQVGWSILAILKSVHACNFIKLNVIYVLPTRNASAEFVTPKVNPMLKRNPELAKMVKKTDNKTLKEIGDRWLYFKGAYSEGEAISTSADLIVADEYDRSNQSVLSMYQSRLQASKYRWFWRFSNPSLPGFGVDELFNASDQMHWFITCPHCGHEWYMNFEYDSHEKNHYVKIINEQKDSEQGFYACGNCHKELSDDDRQSGRWLPKYPERSRRGYWICQMMVPWVSATHILKQKNDMTIDVFHNMVLGLPYQASEFVINGDSILRACNPGPPDKTNVIIGCDSGKVKHWVMGNPEGIFAYGTTTAWEDIERLITMYNATCVIDALPDFTVPEQLARKYPGQVFVHYYVHDSKSLNVTERKEGEQFGVLQSDRTKLFDMVAARITGSKLRFFQVKDALGDLIYHFEQMYRVVELDTRGILRARWETKVGKPDHFAHAAAYYIVGLSMTLINGETGGVQPAAPVKGKTSYAVNPVTQSAPVTAVLGMPLETFIDRSLARNKRKRVQ